MLKLEKVKKVDGLKVLRNNKTGDDNIVPYSDEILYVKVLNVLRPINEFEKRDVDWLPVLFELLLMVNRTIPDVDISYAFQSAKVLINPPPPPPAAIAILHKPLFKLWLLPIKILVAPPPVPVKVGIPLPAPL